MASRQKINFRPVLNFALFSKVRKYEIKYRTKICDLTYLKAACSWISVRLWVCRLNVCAGHVSCTEEPLARFVEESNSLHCGCNLAMRSWPSASWAPVVQHWTSVGSPAGPDGAKMSFVHSPARHLQETKSHKTFSWNKGKSILFHTFSPAHYIWLSLFLKSCSSYLERSSSTYSNWLSTRWTLIIFSSLSLTRIEELIMTAGLDKNSTSKGKKTWLGMIRTRASSRVEVYWDYVGTVKCMDMCHIEANLHSTALCSRITTTPTKTHICRRILHCTGQWNSKALAGDKSEGIKSRGAAEAFIRGFIPS